jgi:GNAT superfamily N-acetyltransferase
MGKKMINKMMEMKPIFEPLETARKTTMKGRKYIYLVIIGVTSDLQGKGFGKKILNALIEESEKLGLPIYLRNSN